jgi:uncharacterized protein YxjI
MAPDPSTTSSLPPPGAPPGPPPGPPAARPAPAAPAGATKRNGRPAFGALVGAAIAFGLLRTVGRILLESWLGEAAGDLVAAVCFFALVLGWRAHQRAKARRAGGVEHTPEQLAKQLGDSGLAEPAYEEDGSLMGASVFVLNQRPKVLEVQTEYELFGSAGHPLGRVRQIAQSKGKQTARVLTPFDQYFTHHFEVDDADGQVALRLTRPRKWFRSKLRVFDAQDRYLGELRQENVFWKIRFALVDANGRTVGRMRARNVRAWDFHVEVEGEPAATIVKSWEGWGRTAFTRADRYVLRIDRYLEPDVRRLVMVSPLMIDLALKQDARGLG